MPFFSIIVPVYNSSQYLHRCIDSILNQTYKDFECILVNDGSTDNSGLICDEYAQKDIRVRVFHKENGGVSSARNKGIRESCGKYIVFVDSDDYIWPERLERVANVTLEKPDMVLESYSIPTDKLHKIKEIEEQDFQYVNNTCVIWTSIYKNAIIQENKIYYDESIWHGEDSLFILEYFYHCSTIAYLDGYGYVYEKGHENGLSIKFQSWEKEFYVFTKIKEARQKIINKLTQNSKSLFMNLGEIIRIIKAMYFESNSLCLSNRIKNLKKLRKELNSNEAIDCKRINSNYLIYFLFKYNLYILLDCFMVYFWSYRNKK